MMEWHLRNLWRGYFGDLFRPARGCDYRPMRKLKGGHVNRFNIRTEVQKAVRGRKTVVPIESLFDLIAGQWLEIYAPMPKDIAELERMFGLEDPR